MIYRLNISHSSRRVSISQFKESFIPILAKELISGKTIGIQTFEDFMTLVKEHLALGVEVTKKSVIFDDKTDYRDLIKYLKDGRGFYIVDKNLSDEEVRIWHPSSPETSFEVSYSFYKNLMANGLPIAKPDKASIIFSKRYGVTAETVEGVLLKLIYDEDSISPLPLADLCSRIAPCCVIRGRQIPGRFINIALDDNTLKRVEGSSIYEYFRRGYYLTVDHCSSAAVTDFVTSFIKREEWCDLAALCRFEMDCEDHIEGDFRLYFDLGFLCCGVRPKASVKLHNLYETLSLESRQKYAELLPNPLLRRGVWSLAADTETRGFKLKQCFMKDLNFVLSEDLYAEYGNLIAKGFNTNEFTKNWYYQTAVINMIEAIPVSDMSCGQKYMNFVLALAYLCRMEHGCFEEILPEYLYPAILYLSVLFEALKR